MSIPSGAERGPNPSPDESLIEPAAEGSERASAPAAILPDRDTSFHFASTPAAYSHRKLTYPLGRAAPQTGEIHALLDDIGWTRSPVPGSLGHINLWLLDDGDRLVIVDSGLDIPPAREGWEALLSGPLAGRPVDRILVTHFHPDHIGLAGWLTERFDARLWMTRTEWLFARMLVNDVRDAPPGAAVDYWRAAGWAEERISAESAKGWGRFASAVSEIPVAFVRMQDGDRIDIGKRQWQVVIGNGHSPEHACLLDEEGKVLIAGDQVLPRISSNVSLSLSEPEADPLGDWLSSLAKMRELPDDLLVLPSHGEPFYGLHARLDALDAGHRGRLDALHQALERPRRAVDCFTLLFGRAIGDDSLGLATGEALAHLRRLEVEGRVMRKMEDGVAWWEKVRG